MKMPPPNPNPCSLNFAMNHIAVGARALGLAALLLLATNGCSTFSREWKTATATPAAQSDITGSWEGKWLSDINGHTGKLRCVMSKKSGDTYEAHFWASFWKIFHATYKVDLHAQQETDRYRLRGQAELGGLAGGTYYYSGYATPTNFFCNYSSKIDHGTFEMTRPLEKR